MAAVLLAATLLQQATRSAAPAAGTGPCHGPTKCASAASLAPGTGRFCVGFEGPSVYCYGKADGCMWGSSECTSDADCAKYSATSPKYTDHDIITCPEPAGAWTEADCKGSGAAGLPAAGLCGWRTDACTCERLATSWGGSFLVALGLLSGGYVGGGVYSNRGTAGPRGALAGHPHYSRWLEVRALVGDGLSFSRAVVQGAGTGGSPARQQRERLLEVGHKEGGRVSSPKEGGKKEKKKQKKWEGRETEGDAGVAFGDTEHAAVPEQPPAAGTAAGGGGRWVHLPS